MKERLKNTGITPREEKITNGRRILQSDFQNDPQYNKYIINYHTKKSIDIKMYDEKYTNSYGTTMKFQTKHNDIVECGTIFYDTKLNEYWLCLESALVGDIHYEGKLAKCNRLLKWQESNGNIYEIPIVNRNASQYNNGETGTATITLASDQLFIYTQLNEHTVILDHGIKFFIDENKDNPTVYKLTRPDTIDYSYMGVGMMGMIVTECAYTPTKEELEYEVCGYHSPTNPSAPPIPGETTDLSVSISGNPKLKFGLPRTYTALFIDNEGNIVEDIEFEWRVISEFDVDYSCIDEKSIKLKVSDEQYIDSSFLLQIFIQDKLVSELQITVVELMY